MMNQHNARQTVKPVLQSAFMFSARSIVNDDSSFDLR
jgi:hypothetical protein